MKPTSALEFWLLLMKIKCVYVVVYVLFDVVDVLI